MISFVLSLKTQLDSGRMDKDPLASYYKNYKAVILVEEFCHGLDGRYLDLGAFFGKHP